MDLEKSLIVDADKQSTRPQRSNCFLMFLISIVLIQCVIFFIRVFYFFVHLHERQELIISVLKHGYMPLPLVN